jgi:hypothetical protein
MLNADVSDQTRQALQKTDCSTSTEKPESNWVCLSAHDSTASQFYLSVRRHAAKGVTGIDYKQSKEDFCDAHLPFFNGLVTEKQ